MSTDHYNIDGPRSSSRVLKPPGGSYTDILGVKPSDGESSKNSKNAPKSEIADCFKICENQPKPPVAENIKETEKEEPQKNGNTKDNETSEKKDASPPQKVRVPPGGWSSGLW